MRTVKNLDQNIRLYTFKAYRTCQTIQDMHARKKKRKKRKKTKNKNKKTAEESPRKGKKKKKKTYRRESTEQNVVPFTDSIILSTKFGIIPER